MLTTTVTTTAAGCRTKNGRVDLEHRHRLCDTFSTKGQGTTSPHSTRKSRGDKPAKPSKDYPLTPHDNGQWCKKIKGKVWFFGTWDDPQEALNRYLDEKDDILAGRDPRRSKTGTKLVDLVNQFLTDRTQKVTEGANISQEHFNDLNTDCGRLLEAMGRNTTVEALRPEDFARLRSQLAEGVSPKTLEGRIARLRSVFQFGVDIELYDSVRWGVAFKKPVKRQLERDRNLKREKHGEYAFGSEQVRAILDKARPQIRAMVLLGIQAGFQNADCVKLPIAAVHFDDGQIRMVRRKTGSWRVVPLWEETAAALRQVFDQRPEPSSDEDNHLVFITKYRNRWHRDNVSQEFRKVLDDLEIYRPGLTFSALRKTFRTVADGAGDQPAAFSLMGHSMGDISDKYRERIDVARLRAVVDHVRNWLFPPAEEEKEDQPQTIPFESAG
jgi:integrase